MSNDAKTIVVAMSGGVDSSTVAAMLCSQGYKVIGITLQLYDYGSVVAKKGACCAGQDIYDAKRVADKLGIPHYILDYESVFKESVIDDFADSYMRGETPLPCVKCNQTVKFKDLLKFAKDLKADGLATGHYVKKVINHGKSEMHRGLDLKKDQSYFLFATTQEQLNYLMFPLGAMSKEETRKAALQYGLEVADKPDSQDICFVPNGDYREIVKKVRPGAVFGGAIMHMDGYKLGEHKGIINYTIGQRRGLGVAATGDPLYVVKIDPENNVVYLGPKEALAKTRFTIKDVNWLGCNTNLENQEFKVKIRSTTEGVPANIKLLGNDQMEVTLLTQEKAVSPGQACVVYDSSRMMGGGWITRDIS